VFKTFTLFFTLTVFRFSTIRAALPEDLTLEMLSAVRYPGIKIELKNCAKIFLVEK
jgi:hypothetical protein